MKRLHIGGAIVVSLLSVSAVLAGRERTATGPAAGRIKASSADFVVTSPGDAGPGTLRDAILAADRLSNRAHITIKAKRVSIESALPALVNPHGVTIDAEADSGVIDAAHLTKGAAMQITSPASDLRGLSIINSREFGIVVNAPGVTMESISVSNSKVGVVLGAAAKGCAIRTSQFEHDDTGITAEAGVRDVVIASSIFRGNTRAGFWFVSSDGKETDPTTESVKIIDAVFEKNGSGVVLANRPVLVQKSRFIGNLQTAILILGGAAKVEDSEFRGTVGTAVSVTAGKQVFVTHNTFADNLTTAIMVRDSQVTIERNTLQGNGFGIVSILSLDSGGTVIRDNLVAKSTGDGITVIGGSPRVLKNQVTDNHSAGMRILDLVQASGSVKATPQLDANVFKGNGIDLPPPATYKLAGVIVR